MHYNIYNNEYKKYKYFYHEIQVIYKTDILNAIEALSISLVP